MLAGQPTQWDVDMHASDSSEWITRLQGTARERAADGRVAGAAQGEESDREGASVDV